MSITSIHVYRRDWKDWHSARIRIDSTPDASTKIQHRGDNRIMSKDVRRDNANSMTTNIAANPNWIQSIFFVKKHLIEAVHREVAHAS
jgi:hypothetical protein